MRRPWFNYKQEYIPHAYLERCIPATEDNDVSCKIKTRSSFPGRFKRYDLLDKY